MNLLPQLSRATRNVSLRMVAMALSRSLSRASRITLFKGSARGGVGGEFRVDTHTEGNQHSLGICLMQGMH